MKMSCSLYLHLEFCAVKFRCIYSQNTQTLILEPYLYLCICFLNTFNWKTTAVAHYTSKNKGLQRPAWEFLMDHFPFFPGDIYKEEIWINEEGLWAECSVWLWDCSHHLQQHQQTVPVCQHWHGQSVAEIYWVQWATWESNELGYCWGKMCSVRILCYLCSESEVFKARGVIMSLEGWRTYSGGCQGRRRAEQGQWSIGLGTGGDPCLLWAVSFVLLILTCSAETPVMWYLAHHHPAFCAALSLLLLVLYMPWPIPPSWISSMLPVTCSPENMCLVSSFRKL